ncbi:hypothetical protein [Plantactinospora sp. GCM10030261]|uniref:hypothetical protein n=1 Tax=Plantactinospora sp. GCM10030261 TaxID=3273420 RepID=UPI00361494D9
MTKTGVRRLAGALIALLGFFILYGGLFVPIGVIVRDREMIPAPESWVAFWIIGVGVLLAVWPSRRRAGGR